jgi:hypothetical protein
MAHTIRHNQAGATAENNFYEALSMQKDANLSTVESKQNLSSVVIPLLKGVLYQENAPEQWNSLLTLQAQTRDYVSILGLELILNESEGYAFLRAKPDDESEESGKIPRLIARRPLSFPVSLLLALLRKKLAEFDAKGGETRLVLSREEIADAVRIFYTSGSNEARLIDQIDTHIEKVLNLGFVRPLKGQENMFEVKRILKAYIDAQWLSEFDQRLQEYRSHFLGSGSSND